MFQGLVGDEEPIFVQKLERGPLGEWRPFSFFGMNAVRRAANERL